MNNATSPALSPERWAQVKTLFTEAAELPTGSRNAWLAERCGTDASLRAEIAKLLAADERADAFLETAPISQLAREQLAEGESVGAYRIIRELGRGGMGTVYLAERASVGFEQRVALKVIKRGMDSDEVLRRFYAERQILAQLNHPHIARLLDGGQTADGRPFYVMEYIEGVALDDYAQTHALPVDERLRLFQQVCAAVQYAHQQLVIHRDLKPSNILVMADGTAKLLDFGIAKVLSKNGESDDKATVTQMMMLTPAYASPEQLRGARLTTASDVYALGVILYELLTGVSPYQTKPEETHALTKEICETEPQRPSLRALRTGQAQVPAQKIDAELDHIVMMALRKEATRRYASVEQFSEDLRRYLAGLPVHARPDTFGYRARKFVQRNRTLTAATLAVALSLTGGLALVLRQARIAERERALAERRFDEVRQLANKFVFDYHDELAKLQGSTALRQRMVNDAKGYLTRLAQDAGGDDSLRLELAQAWIKIGDVQGKPYLANLGQTDEALKSYEQARQLAEAVAVGHRANAKAQLVLGLTMQSLGHIQTRAGQFKTALPLLERAVTLLQSAPSTDFATQTMLAQTYLALGDCLTRSGNAAAEQKRAIEIYQQGLRLNETLLAAQPEDRSRRRRALAIIEQRLGVTVANNAKAPDDLARARDHHQHATALFAAVAAADPANAATQRDLMDQYQMQAEVLAKVGETEKALADCQRALAFFAQRAAAEPLNAEAQRDLATAHYIHCTILQSGKHPVAAIAAMRQAVAIYERLAARDPNNAENYQDLAAGYGRIADTESHLGHTAQAEAATRRMEEYLTKVKALRSR
ncbi:MAG: serine/threonine protein kinase [Acidobacteria bacterium]|nr:serine/threonine protein kinase [Acidobacteriota bacterium]